MNFENSNFEPTEYLPYDFANRRHIGPSPQEMEKMLKLLGLTNIDQLIDQTIPSSIKQKKSLDWEKPKSEREMLFHLRETSLLNKKMISLIGQGYHGTITPPAIQRNILENPAWYTSYTPYQPEISQGRLEALLNFQTMVSDLTGLAIANASLLDESTACAEAMTMAKRIAKNKSINFFVDHECHPQNIEVLKTRAEPLGLNIVIGDPYKDVDYEDCFGTIFQYPGTFGALRDFTSLAKKLHEKGALVIISADPMSLTLLKEPGSMGADIAVGSTQRFGVPQGFGGPHAAYMATKETYKRFLPGRIVGVSIDTKGNKAYRLALQTREQHIRREKATSNVCTAQALLAVMASFYAVMHGPVGLKAIAQRIHRKTVRLAKGLEANGFNVEQKHFFDTITIDVGPMQNVILKSANREGINLRKIGDSRIGVSLDERTRPAIIEAVWRSFGIKREDNDLAQDYRIPNELYRNTEFLTHPVFHMNRAESEMTRYMRRLVDRDIALDRSMIPLGSCTMKLNAVAEMLPLSWPEFSQVHPFAPKDQTLGYQKMIDSLSKMLCDVTGYDSISMQSNSGAQGEYAGLLTIGRYHRSRGDNNRDICLIPMSAHGTNPASAQMAGLQVVPVNTSDNGDVDIKDFESKAKEFEDRLSCCMITYPSTHGVFEAGVSKICEITHKFGGQIYLDGANLNAMVGLVKPGEIGADVSHLNLHKTFAIPHGGGGPGMGPIAVKDHLTPFLPGNPVEDTDGGAVSAAPFGSGSILTISWAYCLMMGGTGLTQATRVAILNANYIAKKLGEFYPILYTGPDGRIAHECIVDIRPLTKDTGVSVDDISKRLVDCGFHAPTMSFPVAGTLMIEPTESETKAELDRFCDAMIAIFHEAKDIEEGRIDPNNNPLKNAPHTVEDLVGEWERPYTREQACFPPGSFRVDKYWPPVNRIDNVHGDRNLICTCPPMSSLEEENKEN